MSGYIKKGNSLGSHTVMMLKRRHTERGWKWKRAEKQYLLIESTESEAGKENEEENKLCK